MNPRNASKNALLNVLEATAGERIIIVCDDTLRAIGDAFAEGALDLGLWARLVILESKGIRKEIPSHLHEIFSSEKPDIFINLLRGSSEETPFRIKITKLESKERKRLGHCPGVTIDMLTDGALALESEEYKKMQNFALRLVQKLRGSKSVSITTPKGTNLALSVDGRPFFTDTVIDWHTMRWINLPVGEVIVGPVENSLEGRLVCDMALGGVSKFKMPITITAKEGKVLKIDTKEKEVYEKVNTALQTDSWSNVVGEFAVGVNTKARLTSEFLECEKIYGTCHVAFGNNSNFPGGKNNSANHIDFLMSKPTVEIIYEDGSELTVLKDGKFRV